MNLAEILADTSNRLRLNSFHPVGHKRSQVSQAYFDRGLYSDTLATVRLMLEFERDGSQSPKRFCQRFSLSESRVQHLMSSAFSIARQDL